MLKFTIQKLSALYRSLAAITLALPGVALAALPNPRLLAVGRIGHHANHPELRL